MTNITNIIVVFRIDSSSFRTDVAKHTCNAVKHPSMRLDHFAVS
jgi:hypothetical protein